eukprot:CAMPEP_0168318682 /NCGR_PEP_ID=MMETSP0213-20121227/619_1 /TAXON_ID=151035 /ORGANISM="Euplotes harpa, Strain FSP1.4" /LENGTH=89 /DNA_ID=CAMNT_0008319785 /DNA_START=745 /DNA_END=1014 /DNA_ORIENTATION=-
MLLHFTITLVNCTVNANGVLIPKVTEDPSDEPPELVNKVNVVLLTVRLPTEAIFMSASPLTPVFELKVEPVIVTFWPPDTNATTPLVYE